MYHHVNTYPDDFITVTVESFDQQMAYIRKRFRSLFLDEVEACLYTDTPQDRSVVAVTFDDGYADFWFYAFPILKKHGVKATVFVNTGRIFPGRSPRSISDLPVTPPRHAEIEKDPQPSAFLSWAEMEVMERSGLVRIESHTRSHVRCDASISQDHLIHELSLSKAEIEKHLGKECQYLAWPYGIYDARAKTVAAACGYRMAVTTFKGTNTPGDDLMQLRRITGRNRSLAWFRFVLWLFSSKMLSEAYLTLKGEPRPLK